MIHCYDSQGTIVPMPAELVIFRPAVYGILIDEYEQVLLRLHQESQLWHPPGNILEPNEIPTQAVRFHFRQMTGFTPLISGLLYVEDQHRLTDDNQAWHLSVLYYALERPEISSTTVGDAGELSPQVSWRSVAELERQEMLFGYDAIEAAQLRLKV